MAGVIVKEAVCSRLPGIVGSAALEMVIEPVPPVVIILQRVCVVSISTTYKHTCVHTHVQGTELQADRRWDMTGTGTQPVLGMFLSPSLSSHTPSLSSMALERYP